MSFPSFVVKFSLNIPVYVTDAAVLVMKDISTGLVDTTSVLGLTQNAVNIIESETREFVGELITGKTNLKYRIQSESSILLRVKGMSYTNAAMNPADAVLGAEANWTKIATDVKATAGVLLNVKNA